MLDLLLALLGVVSLGLFLLRWQYLLAGLLIYIAFAGALILWSQQSAIFLLAKDLFFVLPLYVAVLLLRPQVLAQSALPPWLTLSLLFLSLVVLLQTLNPGVVNVALALIGAKVWLLYIPLAYITAAMLRTPEDIVRLLRAIVLVAPIPCLVGLYQWSLSEVIGYREALTDFYGEAAASATQNFTQFTMGGVIRRIPSTFSNSASYFVYTLCLLSAALALQALDWSRAWRIFARCLIVLLVIAGSLSGMRAAFVFPPVLLLVYALISGRGVGALGGAVLVCLVSVAFLYATGFDTDELAEGVAEHTGIYQEQDFSWVQFSYALEQAPFGMGTGTNTVSGRFATDGLTDAEKASLGGYEVQFAKTVYELGVFGLVPFLLIMGGLLYHGIVGTLRMRDPRFRRAHAAFGAFVLIVFIYFFKAWVIDVDPANVFFWVYVGLLYRLMALDLQVAVPRGSPSLLQLRRPAALPARHTLPR